MLSLSSRLASTGVLLADGAMATNLYDMGLALGDAPELWLDRHPERIAELHRHFVDAGADIILTNSFRAIARRLRRIGPQARARMLNERAAEIARGVADTASRAVIVAGSVGTTGDHITVNGGLTADDAATIFAELIDGLKTGGVDVIWIETPSSAEEIRAAATAAAHLGMPYTLTASFHVQHFTPAMVAGLIATLPTPPVAIGANCGLGMDATLDAIKAISRGDHGLAIISKSNAGLPIRRGLGLAYPATPEGMAEHAVRAIQAGARIVGACCGTTPGHIFAIRAHIPHA